MKSPADWQLPPGVSREVWDYLHDSSIAERYDASLAGTPLLERDREFVVRHCSPAGRTIDLGCGTCRIAIQLAKSGHDVTAVDLSESMLRIAAAKAVDSGVTLQLLLANIVDLDELPSGAYDHVICMFATLGMIAGKEARQQVLANAFRLLRPGGVFVFHVHARWHHLHTSAGRRWLMRDLARRLARRPDAGDWPMPHHDGQTGWTMHLFTRGEAVRLVRMAGFELVEVEPAGLAANGRLRRPWFCSRFRAYGYLIAARKPDHFL